MRCYDPVLSPVEIQGSSVFGVFGVSIIFALQIIAGRTFPRRLWCVPRGGMAGGRGEPLSPACATARSPVDQPKGFSDFFQARQEFNPRPPYCEPRLSLKLKLHKVVAQSFGCVN